MDGSIFGNLLTRHDHKTYIDDDQDSVLTARLATSPEILRHAWSLRHDAYSSQGYIESKPNGLFMDECDHYPSAKVVVIYKHNVPIATVRVCLYAPGSGIAGSDSIPAMDVFHDEIVDIVEKFRTPTRSPRAVEVMRLARHPDLANDHEPVFALFRMVGYLILHFNADTVISAVRKHHVPFYRRLGFQRMTEPRPYPKLKFETVLMTCMRENFECATRATPVLQSLSVHDPIYHDFMSGWPVPVFGDDHVPTGSGRLLNKSGSDRRTPTVDALIAARASARRQGHGVGLAA